MLMLETVYTGYTMPEEEESSDPPIIGNEEFAREVRRILNFHGPGKRIAYRVAGRMAKVSHAVVYEMAMGDVPRMELVIQFGKGMKTDVNRLLQLAGYPQIVMEERAPYNVGQRVDPTPDPDDWPDELKEAMAYTGELPPELRAYIYKLWAEQAKPHAEIYRRRMQIEAEIAELEKIKGRMEENS